MKRIILLLLSLLMLAGCADVKQLEDESLRWIDIYYACDGEKLTGTARAAIPKGGKLHDNVYAAIELMCKEPASEELFSALPENCKVLSVDVNDGVAEIDFSQEFLQLSSFRKAVAMSCIAQTVSNFAAVKSVRISVCGEYQHDEINVSTFKTEAPQIVSGTDTIEIHLVNSLGEPVSIKKEIELTQGNLPEQIAAEAFVYGIDGCTSLLPEGCVINSMRVSGGTVYIDFSKEFLNAPDEKAYTQIKATVLTFTSVDYIDYVKMTVDGESPGYFGGTNLEREYGAESF